MKSYRWMMVLWVMSLTLAAVPMPASAQCGGGQMDHSAMGSYGQMMYGSGGGHMSSSGQMGPGHMGNYGSDPDYQVSAPPPGPWAPVPSGQTTPGSQTTTGHENHNH